jgi:LGFP repeat-containing protein
VNTRHGILVGFTLDPIGGLPYSPYPRSAGPNLERTASVLAIQGYASEVFSGLIKNGPPCPDNTDWRKCDARDNNKPIENLEDIADWKSKALQDWIATGVPVILDVSNGFDGRIIWAKNGAAFWGDNLDYTDDHWRNWQSELKGPGVKGITVNTWNGYTEGYASLPSIEHGDTVYNWLVDLLEPPPWDFSHMHYVNGARTWRVYGAICGKWIKLGADRVFAEPVGDERSTERGRMQYFTDGKAIYWTVDTGAHAVIGIIAKTYLESGAGGSCLGFPIHEEQPDGQDRVQYFEHGRINWSPGDFVGRITC